MVKLSSAMIYAPFDMIYTLIRYIKPTGNRKHFSNTTVSNPAQNGHKEFARASDYVRLVGNFENRQPCSPHKNLTLATRCYTSNV